MSERQREVELLRSIARLLQPVVLGLILVSVTGCAYVEEGFQDDTTKPAFEVGYRTGETYRLRTDGQLARLPDTHRLELWSPRWIARNAKNFEETSVIATVPAGSMVNIDGLEHNYTFAIPPVPGDSQILRAYGTVESLAGHWVHVSLPYNPDEKWSFVPGTSVMAFPPDHDFLELVKSPTQGW